MALLRTALLVTGLGIALLVIYSQPPNCRVAAAHADPATANAGCLIRQGTYLLVLENPNGRLDFPGGTSEPGESAQCTAHRETWEETGIDVEVGALLHVFNNEFRLYACQPADPNIRPGNALTPPWLAWSEVRHLYWQEADAVKADSWRYPRQWPQVLQLFAGQP